MTTDPTQAKHLWHSLNAERCGCSLNKARTTGGEYVVYTCATRDRAGTECLWDDKRYLGELSEYLGGLENGYTYHTKHWRTQ